MAVWKMVLWAILIVVGLVGALLTLVYMSSKSRPDVMRQWARGETHQLARSVFIYTLRNGEKPETLGALVDPPDGYRVLAEPEPRDPWGRPYMLLRASSGVQRVCSQGHDPMSTEDDICARVRSLSEVVAAGGTW